jgi:hypothetical protein
MVSWQQRDDLLMHAPDPGADVERHAGREQARDVVDESWQYGLRRQVLFEDRPRDWVSFLLHVAQAHAEQEAELAATPTLVGPAEAIDRGVARELGL